MGSGMGLGSVMGEIAPPALGIALSPFSIIPAIFMLFTSRARAAGGAFLAGWVVGIAVAAGAFAVLFSIVELLGEPPVWVSWTRIGLGALLVLFGAWHWYDRKGKAVPGWMRSLEATTPARALWLGLGLSAANPKILLLAAAGGLGIGSAGLSAAGVVGAVAVFTGLAACTVALPLVLHLLLGERIVVPLGRAKDWLEVHSAAFMALVITVLGLLLVVKGVGGL
ncbi:GAP family protein [Streptosporangium sp. CA-135522]|uniref:GAP family protein n=1 Tax=Streptosporangium sp. CA-135522 TaxID=3240072 RepID=UPI003D9093FC